MDLENFAGRLLMSTPMADKTCDDSYFSRSVVYICCDDKENGTIGVVVNKTISDGKNVLAKSLEISHDDIIKRHNNLEILLGGPSSSDKIFVIYGEDIPNSRIINISCSRDLIHDFYTGSEHNDYCFSLGFSSWEEGQLMAEFSNNQWEVVPFSKEIIFSPQRRQLYNDCCNKIGFTPGFMVAETTTA